MIRSPKGNKVTVPWRLGKRIKQNVYEGDRPVAQFHSVEDAILVVTAVNYLKCAEDKFLDARVDMNVQLKQCKEEAR